MVIRLVERPPSGDSPGGRRHTLTSTRLQSDYRPPVMLHEYFFSSSSKNASESRTKSDSVSLTSSPALLGRRGVPFAYHAS